MDYLTGADFKIHVFFSVVPLLLSIHRSVRRDECLDLMTQDTDLFMRTFLLSVYFAATCMTIAQQEFDLPPLIHHELHHELLSYIAK